MSPHRFHQRRRARCSECSASLKEEAARERAITAEITRRGRSTIQEMRAALADLDRAFLRIARISEDAPLGKTVAATDRAHHARLAIVRARDSLVRLRKRVEEAAG